MLRHRHPRLRVVCPAHSLALSQSHVLTTIALLIHRDRWEMNAKPCSVCRRLATPPSALRVPTRDAAVGPHCGKLFFWQWKPLFREEALGKWQWIGARGGPRRADQV